MSNSGQSMAYRRLRAPRHPGQSLIDPPSEQLPSILATNRSAWDHCTTPLLGVPLNEVAWAAREHLLDAAFDYTTAYRHPLFPRESVTADTQLVLSGHQPRLFHPGVWFKNFVLHTIAAARKAVGIQLIIDNDLSLATSIQVPGGSVDQPQQSAVAFDRQENQTQQVRTAIPFEAATITDVDFFATFPERVQETMSGLMTDPDSECLVERLWEHAMAATKRSDNLGICLSQARHLLEADYGLETLEVPLSRLCDHASFLHFAAHLLQSPRELHGDYNNAILEYRTVHGLRSQSHPAPLLEQVVSDDGEDWFEAPFWIWSETSPMRDRLFLRLASVADRGETGLEACRGLPTDGGQRFPLPLKGQSRAVISDGATLSIGDLWLERLQAEGLRLRPRALITTMFARVFLSDLFLHGIGGSKYDQVTDQLIESRLGIAAPAYVTVTATMHLPIARHAVDGDDLRQMNGMLRELWFHPETMLPDDPGSDQAEFQAELKKKKKKLLASRPERGQRKDWNDDLQRINTQLRELAQPFRSILIQQRSELIQRLRGDSILASREYAYCLFSRQKTGQNLLDMAATVS